MDFFKKIWITGSTSIVVTILAFVNNVIVTRALGPEGRGIYAVISNLILLLMLIFGEGIRRSNVILIGRKKNATRQLLIFTLKYSAVLILIFVFILLIKPVYDSLLPNISTLLLVLGFAVAFFTILWQAVQALSLGQQKIIDYNVMMFAQIAVVIIINILGVLLFNFSVGEFITSLLVGACLTLLIGVIRLKYKRNDFNKNYKINLSEVFLISLKSTSASILMFLTLRGDIFLINYFLDSYQAGIYAVAILFSEILKKIPSVIGPLVISQTVGDFSSRPAFDTIRLIRVVFLLSFLVVMMLLIWGESIILLLFGNIFLEAFNPLVLLLPGLFFLGSGGVAYAYFMGRAYPALVIYINFFTGIANIVLNIFLIPKYGISAAAIISSFTYSLWTLGLIFYLAKQTKSKISEILFIKIEDINYLIKKIKGNKTDNN